MDDVTLILSAVERGEPRAADRLLSLIYAELRRQAARKMAQEKPGQTLTATALVHEAYLRLFGDTAKGELRSTNIGTTGGTSFQLLPKRCGAS